MSNFEYHEWTAFREADLFTKDGNSVVNIGESFEMPGATTVTLGVYDNDSSLSGGRGNRSADGSQHGYIDGSRLKGRDHDVFADRSHQLLGSDGKVYTLIEIGIERHNAAGAGDDYFTFLGDVPPAGVVLTVTSSKNIPKSGVSYDQLGATPLEQDAGPAEGFVKLDFEGLASGDTVDGQFVGVTISAQRDRNNTAENDAMIFDSNNVTGGDHDLSYEGRGNILIVSEDNDASDADDAVGGSINFAFDAPSDLDSITVLDVEESGGTIVLTFADGSTETIAIPAKGDNSAQVVQLNATNVASMEINLVGSGAIDDLFWAPGVVEAPAEISGTYFLDANKNGIRDEGDTTVADALVTLLNADGTSTGATTTTDANGDYVFADIDAGDYRVDFAENLDGFVFIAADDPQNVGDDTNDSDVDATGVTGVISVGAGDTATNQDAGIADPGTASIGSTVFLDANGNGIQDEGEGGVDGVNITLFDAETGATIATTISANGGQYLLDDLDAGNYMAFFAVGDEFAFSPQGFGDDVTLDSDPSILTGLTDVISLSIGEDNLNIDAGFISEGQLIVGTSGRDTLFGTNQNDTIDGAGNKNFMYGGAGADTFVFDSTGLDGRRDEIPDFSVFEGDVIDLSLMFEESGLTRAEFTDAVIVKANGVGSTVRVELDGVEYNVVSVHNTTVDEIIEYGALIF